MNIKSQILATEEALLSQMTCSCSQILRNSKCEIESLIDLLPYCCGKFRGSTCSEFPEGLLPILWNHAVVHGCTVVMQCHFRLAWIFLRPSLSNFSLMYPFTQYISMEAAQVTMTPVFSIIV